MAEGAGGAFDAVGRESELTTIVECLDRLTDGIGGFLMLEGEAGIGKSHLLARGQAAAGDRGVLVYEAKCEELESGPPFGPLARALDMSQHAIDSQVARIARMLQNHPHEDPTSIAASSHRFLIQEAMVEVMEAQAVSGPLLLVIDDLQWADEPSLATLAALSRRSHDLPVLLMTAHRPEPPLPAGFLEAVFSAGARSIHVGPLSQEAIERLVASVAVTTAVGPELGRLVDGARGNPLLVIELVRSLRDDGALEVVGSVADTQFEGLPLTLRQSVMRRLQRLPPSALQLLRVAAVLGGTFALDDLAAVLERSPVSLHDDVLLVIRTGLLAENGSLLELRHDLIGDAIYSSTPEPVRASLHRQSARVYRAAGAAAVLVANHLIRAAPSDTTEALTTEKDAEDLLAAFEEAADELGGQDPAAALTMLERAAGVTTVTHDQRLALDARSVPLLVAAGRVADAEKRARAGLAAAPPPETRAHLEAGLAEVMALSGDPAAAVQQYESALAEQSLDEHRRAALLADAARVRLASFDLEGAARDAHVAADWATKNDDAAIRTTALTVQCRLAAYDADFDRAVTLGERAVEVAGASPLTIRRTPHFYLGLALLNADRAAEAIDVLRKGLALAEKSGAPGATATNYSGLIMCGFHTGAWDDATAEAEAVRNLHVETGSRLRLLQIESTLGLMWFHQGDITRARTALERAEEDLAHPGYDPGGIIWLLWLRAAFSELDGDSAAAAARLGHAFDLAVKRRVHSVKLWYGPEVVRLTLAAGDRERARRTTEEVERIAESAGTAAARGAAMLCRGRLDADLSTQLAAVDAYRTSSRRFDLALACEAAGVTCMRRTKGTGAQAAVSVLEEARAVCEDIGAAHDARRIVRRLRALGVRKGARGERRRPLTGPESLTPSEREVLLLVGEGLTNRDIADRLYVSRRTVESHVGRLYAKLQVHGRVALARLAGEIG